MKTTIQGYFDRDVMLREIAKRGCEKIRITIEDDSKSLVKMYIGFGGDYITESSK